MAHVRQLPRPYFRPLFPSMPCWRILILCHSVIRHSGSLLVHSVSLLIYTQSLCESLGAFADPPSLTLTCPLRLLCAAEQTPWLSLGTLLTPFVTHHATRSVFWLPLSLPSALQPPAGPQPPQTPLQQQGPLQPQPRRARAWFHSSRCPGWSSAAAPQPTGVVRGTSPQMPSTLRRNRAFSRTPRPPMQPPAHSQAQ